MPEPVKTNQGLGRHQRITHTAQFKETFDQQQKWVGRYMVLWLRTGEGASLRLGVVTSKKVGNAVARARTRRLLREVYRRNRAQFKGKHDVILVGRQAVLKAKWQDIVNDLLNLAQKAGLL